jgi:hypothetical protein
VTNNVQPTAVWTLHPHHVLDKDADVLLFDIERQIGPPIRPDQVESAHGVSVCGTSLSGGAKRHHCSAQQYRCL